jgi:hypothetical protein
MEGTTAMSKPEITEETIFDWDKEDAFRDRVFQDVIYEDKIIKWERASDSHTVVVMSRANYNKFKAILDKYEAIEDIMSGANL